MLAHIIMFVCGLLAGVLLTGAVASDHQKAMEKKWREAVARANEAENCRDQLVEMVGRRIAQEAVASGRVPEKS